MTNEEVVAKIEADRLAAPSHSFWSQTYTGEAFYYDEVKLLENAYKLDDIAHQLATINRYGGAAIYPYSVAQHSVALAVAVWFAYEDASLALDALFHDAEEAFVGDMRTPMKDRFPEFRAMSAHVDAAIRLAMRDIGIMVPAHERSTTRAYDRRIIANERPIVMQPSKKPWYGMEGVEPIPNLNPVLFEETNWRDVRTKWRCLVDTFNLLAKFEEDRRKIAWSEVY